MPDPRVVDAYALRAGEYADLFGCIDAAAEQDRELLLAWAQGVNGRVVDVGCGPGQWTNYLHERGVDIEGVDPVPAFIDHARRRFPGVGFHLGSAERLPVEDAGVGGILAWYSLIHSTPDEVGVTLAEFARCIRLGGGLAIGFFVGADLAPFDHAVTTAYFWPVDMLAGYVERAGFEVTETRTRAEPGARPQGSLIARRVGQTPPQ